MSSLMIDGVQYSIPDVIEALTPHLVTARIQRLHTVLNHRLGSVVLGIEDLHQGFNGAACVRTAEGLGLQDVVAAELREPFSTDTQHMNRRVTSAAHHWVDVHRVPSTEALMVWAQQRDMRIFAAGPRGDCTLQDLPIDRPVMLLFGNERDGLRTETMAACDGHFRIPMYGFTESYNISVSAGMSLSAVSERVRARLADEGRTGDLSATRKTELFARWCVRSVRHSSKILQLKLGAL